LDVDEIEAARLLIQTHGGQVSDDKSFLADAVRNFHDRRDLLLQNIRIALQESLNLDHEDNIRAGFQNAVSQILDTKIGPPSNGSTFTHKCTQAMQNIERWHDKVVGDIQSKAILNEQRGPVFYATLEFQRSSLVKQHEALGCIVAFLFRGNYTLSEDLRKLKEIPKRWQRLDLQLIHYLPAFSAAFRQYGSPEASASQDQARSLNRAIVENKDAPPSTLLRPFSAVLELWWTVEYSGCFRESPEQDADAEKRGNVVKAALDDNALECLLSICSVTSVDAWRHPARQEMVTLLLSDVSGLNIEGEQPSPYFRTMLMECLEFFTEAWITNMPDSIRRLKTEEDDQRLLQITAIQDAIGVNAPSDHIGRLHLECFLMLLSFAFEQRPAAAEQFWEDPDSNLYGFLQWASRRQTVPRVSAFCEMLCSISEGPECAMAAHKFLLDETVAVASSKNRRAPSMNYQQIFSELELYAYKVHERTPTPQLPNARNVLSTDMNELESPVMLSCYLRLLAHLCRQTSVTREYIVEHSQTDLPRHLLLLSAGPVPSHLRASVFATLEALLTDKSSHVAFTMWRTIDQWAANNIGQLAFVKVNQEPVLAMQSLENVLHSISGSFDQYDAFVTLLRSLAVRLPSFDDQLLPFPHDLGSTYRTPGISPYVDFVCGTLFIKRIRELGDEGQTILGSFHCLDFIAGCLESFNESFVGMYNRNATMANDDSSSFSSISYAQRHPFARTMQWLLTTDMSKAMMKTLHVSIDEVNAALPDAPLIATLQRCIDIINLTLDLQPTYLDIVRPLLKDADRRDNMPAVSISFFEDSIMAHPEIIADLCQYAASDHLQLALRALALLQTLSSSPKLNNHFLRGAIGQNKAQRIIDMVGPAAEAELAGIADTLALRLQLDVRELEEGFESSGYLTKDGILAFLNACLSTQDDLPNIAHLLVGFGRAGKRLTVTDRLDAGKAVFNAVVDLTLNYPDGQDGSMVSWLIHIKAAGAQLLQHMWSSELTAPVVMSQLRRFQYLQSQFVAQPLLSQGTVWDGHSIMSPLFWYSTSAEALTEFVTLRACLYHYTTKELRASVAERQNNVQRQILSTLQGRSAVYDGTAINHATMFDLFDFLDLDINAVFDLPEMEFFVDLHLEAYVSEAIDSNPSLYEIAIIRELLQMYQSQILEQSRQSPNSRPVDQARLELESDSIIARLEARNRLTLARKARAQALHNYVDMVVATVECCPMDETAKAQFILHILQLMLPKLDNFVLDEAEETIELARAADTLLFELSQIPSTLDDRINNLITDRLFQLFRTCIEGIPMSNTSVALRTTLYSICSQYLTRIIGSTSDTNAKARNNSMDCIRSASGRLINTLSDDAEDGVDNCRLNALNLLSLLTSLARFQKSNFVVSSLVKANVLEILIEPLKQVALEFQDADPNRKHYTHYAYRSLLTIKRTALSAICVRIAYAAAPADLTDSRRLRCHT